MRIKSKGLLDNYVPEPVNQHVFNVVDNDLFLLFLT